MSDIKKIPLAVKMRPTTIDDMVGQKHLLGRGMPLRTIIESGNIPNMIFYGSSGIGKTTLAYIIASQTKKTLYKLNATTASTSDIKDIIAEIGSLQNENGIVLYLDEIQYFNKKQQQIFLQFIENGDITLIASTTENPYFYVYNAILSRSTVFEFRPIDKREMEKAVKRAFEFVQNENPKIKFEIEDGVIKHLATACGGDVRKAMNTVELLTTFKVGQKTVSVTLEKAKALAQKSNMKYDRDGDGHYDALSALQKSIRGSDENAALHYAARIMEGGDLPSLCRRLLVIAAEDIGLAYPQAITITKSCVDAALQLGLPEARIPLAEAVILLATAPKSNSVICAIDAAISDLKNKEIYEIPPYLLDSHYKGSSKLGHGIGYKYPHNFPNHYVKQQYLPDAIKNAKYYEFGENKTEQAAKRYWDEVKNEKK